MIDLRLGDCLVEMPKLGDASVDAVIADIPYGTTACAWDTVIPFEPMWAQLKRIAKPRAAIVLFGSQPFTSALVMSNPKWFRYEWIWDKHFTASFALCNKKPMSIHENVLIFSANGHTYNPQMIKRHRPIELGGKNHSITAPLHSKLPSSKTYTQKFPTTLIDVSNRSEERGEHPTQKPVALMEYLIRTYTNEGDTVLDFTMGSGTTLVACVRTGRNGIGIENDPRSFEIAQKRITEAQLQMVMPL